MKKGLIHIYCGDGKGKTTAAMGLSVRAAGCGMKVILTQFMKNGTSNEVKVLKNLPNVTFVCVEKHLGFFWNMTQEEKEEAKALYQQLFRHVTKLAIEEEADLLVMDEFMSAYHYGWIDQKEALQFLKNKPEKLEVVLTGRDPGEELVGLADYVTEMRKIKHPYEQGVPARKGIEL